LDRVRTAVTNRNEFTTVERMHSDSAMTRRWVDYPDIEITESTHLKCDGVLCKIWLDGVSYPPVTNHVQGQDFNFGIEMQLFFR